MPACGGDGRLGSIRVEGKEIEVAVAGTAPAPVYVEVVAVGAVAVDDEGMTAALRASVVAVEGGVIDGAVLGNFLIYKVLPSVCAVACGAAEGGVGVVAQLLLEGIEGVAVVGSGGETVVHPGCLSAVAHQRGDGSPLGIGVGAAVAREHVVPIEGGRSPCRHVDFVGLRGVGFKAGHLGSGVSVVVSNLSHCRGDAAGEGCLVGERRAVGIVGVALVPRRGEQWRYVGHHAAGAAACATDRVGFRLRLPEHLNLAGIDGKHLAQGCGHAVGIEGAAVGIAEDGAGAVVATDDDEAVLLADVEHKEAGLARRGALQLCRHLRRSKAAAARRLVPCL